MFNDAALDDLAQSIRGRGILQPLVVHRLASGGYELIAGERRLRAALRLELPTVPVVVRESVVDQLLELALVENIQREDLNPVELAQAYRSLIERNSLTQNELADQLGKKRSTVANVLRFLELPAAIQDALVDGRISAGHAKVLLSVPTAADQLAHFQATLDGGLSVRALEELRDRPQNPAATTGATPPPASRGSRVKAPHVTDQEDQLSRALGTKVEIREGNGRGKIVIEYYSLDDYERISRRLVGRP
ncbi:MAG: ParB/RepB/Spo0J family partition protein [Planctomycetota bacterium]